MVTIKTHYVQMANTLSAVVFDNSITKLGSMVPNHRLDPVQLKVFATLNMARRRVFTIENYSSVFLESK